MQPESSGPWRITFDTNPDDCNLKCIMCEEHSPHATRQEERRAAHRPPRRMDIELIRKVLAESRGGNLREIIPSTMGEPLLYREFDDIIELCREFGVLLNLTTNGTFLRLGGAGWARKLVPVTSDVKISWNGARAATYERVMVGGHFEQAVAHVKEFIAVRDAHAAAGGNRFRVTFQLTFLEPNVAELPNMVKLAAELGVDRVKGHHLWAHFDTIKELSMRRSPESIGRWNEAVRLARETVEHHRRPDGQRVLLENILELTPSATQNLAPALRARSWGAKPGSALRGDSTHVVPLTSSGEPWGPSATSTPFRFATCGRAPSTSPFERPTRRAPSAGAATCASLRLSGERPLAALPSCF